jgi:hypothetical protein
MPAGRGHAVDAIGEAVVDDLVDAGGEHFIAGAL